MKRRNIFHVATAVLYPPLVRCFTTLKDSLFAEKIFFSFFILSIFAVAYLNLEDSAVVKVAERDVVADLDMSYTD